MLAVLLAFAARAAEVYVLSVAIVENEAGTLFGLISNRSGKVVPVPLFPPFLMTAVSVVAAPSVAVVCVTVSAVRSGNACTVTTELLTIDPPVPVQVTR